MTSRPDIEQAQAQQPVEAELSQWQLIGRRFARHRLAVTGMFVLAVLYSLALLAEFVAPYPAQWKRVTHIYAPSQLPRFDFSNGLHVLAVERQTDPVTRRKYYVENPDYRIPLGLFVRGEPYRLWGVIPAERHLVGVDLAACVRRCPQ